MGTCLGENWFSLRIFGYCGFSTQPWLIPGTSISPGCPHILDSPITSNLRKQRSWLGCLSSLAASGRSSVAGFLPSSLEELGVWPRHDAFLEFSDSAQPPLCCSCQDRSKTQLLPLFSWGLPASPMTSSCLAA